MKLSNPFDPFGLWAGPLFFVDLGLQFMRSWQDAWYGRLRLDAPAAAAVGAGDDRLQVEAAIAARQGRSQPWLGCLTGVQVVGGPAAEKEIKAAKPAPAVARPAAQPAAGAVEKAAAEPEAGGAEEAAAPSVTSMLAMQARSLSKAVRHAPKAEPAKAAKKSAPNPAARPAAKKPAAKASKKA